ncbi:UNVERIFIED_CONTAM: Eukaryotic translation initiation factor 3 subunit E [Sesamum radiatum]|uniref:Eukaryotic translation initiation factor 3 subunit E n=1 Tax=Sesamum radiatum TaxID=300843 RepID=A0AAW2TK37_SESRA
MPCSYIREVKDIACCRDLSGLPLEAITPYSFSEVILNDPFLGKRVEEGNFSTVPLRDEFLENARLFIFETYCRIHQRIDMGVLAEKLNLNYEEAERWIVTLIRTSKLEAKIDSKMGTIVMEPNQTNVYEQLIDHTKSLSGRTYKLVNQLLEHAQAQAAR